MAWISRGAIGAGFSALASSPFLRGRPQTIRLSILLVDIRSAAAHPDTFVEQNILGLFYVLEAMRKNRIRTMLFPSSTTVFGELANPPASESHGPMMPLNINGGAKLAAEGLISAWARTYDIQAVVFRLSASLADAWTTTLSTISCGNSKRTRRN